MILYVVVKTKILCESGPPFEKPEESCKCNWNGRQWTFICFLNWCDDWQARVTFVMMNESDLFIWGYFTGQSQVRCLLGVGPCFHYQFIIRMYAGEFVLFNCSSWANLVFYKEVETVLNLSNTDRYMGGGGCKTGVHVNTPPPLGAGFVLFCFVFVVCLLACQRLREVNHVLGYPTPCMENWHNFFF